MASKPRVGFIGAGRMGRPMCRHIAKAGFELSVFDPVPEAVAAVEKTGGKGQPSAKAVGAGSDVVFVMPGFYSEVEQAICGPDGVLDGAAEGCVVVVSSTIKPGEAQKLAARCAEKGVRFVDAPVCQGEIGAEGGFLVWLVGGDAADIEAARPAMAPCGSEIFHLGEVGAGMVGKAINNMLLWAALVADHEALGLAESWGVTKERLIPALLRSSGTNWPLEHWQDMDKIPWAHKDMQIVLELGDHKGVALPVAGLLREQVKPIMRAVGVPGDFVR